MNIRKLYTVRNNFRCVIGKARSGKIPIPHRHVAERHVAERHVAEKTDVVSEKTDVVSEKTDVVSVFPMWYRNFSATCLFRYHIGNYF